jgi:hypothetical protein
MIILNFFRYWGKVVDLRKQQLTGGFSGVQGAVFQKSPLAAGGMVALKK